MPKLPKKPLLKGLPKRIEPLPVPKAKPAKRRPQRRQPKFVYVELLDLSPAASGQSVVVKQAKVEETEVDNIVASWGPHPGFTVRVVDRPTPNDPNILYHPALQRRAENRPERKTDA
jgi:hypothetical protein